MKAFLQASLAALCLSSAPALSDTVQIQGRLQYDPPLTQDDVLASGMCYVLDGLVRRSTALQLTADARTAQAVEGAAA